MGQQSLHYVSLYTHCTSVRSRLSTRHLRSNYLHQRTQHSIVVRPTAVRAISTDIIRQTIVQHCRTSD